MLWSLNGIGQQDFVYASSSNDPKDYSFIENQKLSPVFVDDFSDNRNNWWTGSENIKVSFEYGSMVLRCTNSNAATWRAIKGLNANIDFQIETSIRFNNGKQDNLNGLLFGRDEKGCKFNFGFSNNGYYTIGKWCDSWTDIVSWQKSSIIKTSDWNVVTYRKVGSMAYFFINKQLVHTMPALDFFGNNFGVQVNDDAYAEVDYFNIYEFSPSPPQIIFINPNAGYLTTDKQDFRLKFKVKSVKGLTNVNIFVNDFPVSITLDQFVKMGDEYFAEKALSLNDGDNDIKIAVNNGNSEAIANTQITLSGSSVASVPVRKTAPAVNKIQADLASDVDVNIPTNPTVPNRFALVIGNEDYASYQTSVGAEVNVAYAINDASAFKEYCIKTLGVEERNVFFLTNATSASMLQNIDLVCKIAKALNGRAELIFYYAGHGLPDEVTKEPYLIPVDVSAVNLASAIKLGNIYKKFGESGAKKVTVFLDACFSGGGREAGLLSARGVKVKAKEEVAQGNLVVFSASTGEQSSLPYKDKRHGMFTYFLLKKLQDTKGQISYDQLYNDLKDNVTIESLRTNYKEQTPQVNVSPSVSTSWKGWQAK
jgi:hypothetical protein